ncbi:hypothetical protein Tco_0423225, partial [Tanacetum coccineum]
EDKDKLSNFKAFKGGYVAFGNDSKGGRISRKGTIKTSCLDFEKVSYVEELKFNLLSISQICDKKHNVLFTDKEFVPADSSSSIPADNVPADSSSSIHADNVPADSSSSISADYVSAGRVLVSA